VDDWFWLRDRDDPAVLALLEAENAHTDAYRRHWGGLEERLFDEIRSRILETDLSVPTRHGGWWYYQRTEEGRSYGIHCRLPAVGPGRDASTVPGTGASDPSGAAAGGAESAPGPWPDEQVLLNENDLAEGQAYLQVANLSISPAHRLLSYATDTSGEERYTLRLRHVGDGSDAATPNDWGGGGVGDLPERIEDTSYGLAWSRDESTVFYTRADAAQRPHQLWRHRVGVSPADDVLVYQEDDERFHLGVGNTKDRAYVVLELQSKITTEVQVLDAGDPEGRLRVVAPRRTGIEVGLEHYRGTFLVVTNEDAENFRILARPADDADADPVEIVPHRPDARIEGIDVFSRYLVVSERSEAMARIRIHPLDDDDPFGRPLDEGWLVPMPEDPATSWTGPNPEFDTEVLRYEYGSLVTPRTVYDLDMGERRATVLKRQPVLGGYDPDRYRTERVWARAPDGTAVPVSVVRHLDTSVDGTAPCLLYGYGAYEHSIDPLFSSVRLSLLDRGFVFAIAHVRGGGEMGRRWYEEGRLSAKTNTFSDYVACARALTDGGWSRPDGLVARGGSAGGLLMGAVANAAPELFRAVVAEVPFVDCLTTMSDPSLPLTVIEWDEWGNPVDDAAIYALMRSYSPYDNVHPGHYPDLLVTAGLEDPRVSYWEPAKWVQRVRAADPDNVVYLKIDLEAGHGGPSGRYAAWRDEAFVYAFVLDRTGAAAAPSVKGAEQEPRADTTHTLAD
jgi:oligopeptidase B